MLKFISTKIVGYYFQIDYDIKRQCEHIHDYCQCAWASQPRWLSSSAENINTQGPNLWNAISSLSRSLSAELYYIIIIILLLWLLTQKEIKKRKERERDAADFVMW